METGPKPGGGKIVSPMAGAPRHKKKVKLTTRDEQGKKEKKRGDA